MYFPTHRSPIKIHLVVGFAWSLVRARTQRTSRRGARATTDKNVPTRFFLLPFLTLSPFHRPLPAPPLPSLYPRLIWNGRSTGDMRDCRRDATVGTRRDEPSGAMRQVPRKTPRDDKTTGMRSDLMRRVDTVFSSSRPSAETCKPSPNLVELRTKLFPSLFSNSVYSYYYMIFNYAYKSFCPFKRMMIAD